MNAREKWLTAALVALFLVFGWTGLWQQARHQDAREAVRRYVELNEREEREDAERVALIRQARPEIRRSLTRGEFETALKRLKSLEAEDEEAGEAPSSAKALSIDSLWPPGSDGRKRLEAVLKELVQKQQQGYDVTPAQQQLAMVAASARAGKKVEALDAFNRAADFVQNAQLRPGFKAPVAPAAAPGGGGMPEELRKIEQQIRNIQNLRQQLPQIMAQAQGEQRVALELAQSLFDELVAAYRQKRDIRPVMALLGPSQREFAAAQESKDWSPVLKRLEAARAMIKTLPPLPAALSSPPGAPGNVPPAGGGAGAGTPPGTPGRPGNPGRPAGGPAGAGAQAGAEGLLQALDTIRALPEAEYQARKPMIVALLAQAARQGMLRRPRAEGGSVLGGAPVRLDLGRDGGFQGLQFFGEPLAGRNVSGGLALQLDGKPEIPLRGSWKMEQNTPRFHVEGAEGSVTGVVESTPEGVRLKVRVERTQDGAPGHLRVAVPASFGGWYWVGPSGPEVIAVDREYQVQAAGGKLPKILVRGGAGELSLEAASAGSAGVNAKQSLLWVRLPLGPSRGVIEHTVQLSGSRRTQP